VVELLSPYAHHLTVQIFTGFKGHEEAHVCAKEATKPHKAFPAHQKKSKHTVKQKINEAIMHTQ
jgi:hypothetical protein